MALLSKLRQALPRGPEYHTCPRCRRRSMLVGVDRYWCTHPDCDLIGNFD